MNTLLRSKYIMILLLFLLISFTQSFISSGSEVREDFLEVININSPQYDSQALKDIYDYYKISEDLDIIEQFEKVIEEIKKKPPGILVLQPAALDLKYRGIVEFTELEPIAIKKGEITTISLKFDDRMANASRVYVVDLEIYFDETKSSHIAYNTTSSFTGYNTVQDPNTGEIKQVLIERGPFKSTGLEAQIEGKMLRLDVKVEKESADDERWGGYLFFYQFKIIGVQDGTGIMEVVDTNASEESSESGIPLSAIIVIGVIGLAAASFAIKSKGNKDNKKKEEKSTYTLYIKKDFGGKIKRGGTHEFVYARIVEVKKDGININRDDLTSQIEIFSNDNYIQVGPPTISGDYMGASIKADYFESKGPEEGSVSFRFTGEGGTLQNNVHFKLVGDPYIHFPQKGDNLIPTLNMIYGCNGKYSYKLEFCDFTKPILDVKIEIPRDDLASGVVEKIDEYKYEIKLQNLSQKTNTGTFKTESFNIKIIGENNSEYAEDRLNIVLVPQGLSLVDLGNQFDEEGYLKIICYPDNKESDEVIKTRFKLQLAVLETDKNGFNKVNIISPTEYEIEFGELEGTDSNTKTLVSRYMIDINDLGNTSKGIYRFEPKNALPEPEEGRIYVNLPAFTQYENNKYEIKINLRLMGEPLNPMAGWDEEFDILKKRVERYGLSAELSQRMRVLGKNRSTQELRLLNKMILIESSIYYTNEAREYNDIANRLEQIESGLEVIKWLGDQSFSVLMTIYAGPTGEAIITPAKEILVALIGEVGTQIFMGETFVFENLKVSNNISAIFESYILNTIGPDISMKKAGVVIAGFAIFNFSKHYLLDVDQNGNRDFYKALNSAFSDLTSTTIKIAASKYFENLVNSKKSGDEISGWVSNWLKDKLPNLVFEEAGEKLLSKYLEELCGEGASFVYSTLNEASERGEINKLLLTIPLELNNNGINMPIYVGIDLLKIANSLFDYIYEKMFGSLPLPGEKVNISKDPVYNSNI
jgi:hypothetical protein